MFQHNRSMHLHTLLVEEAAFFVFKLVPAKSINELVDNIVHWKWLGYKINNWNFIGLFVCCSIFRLHIKLKQFE